VSHGEGDSNRVPLPGSSFRVTIDPAATDVSSCMRLFVEERDECGHGLNEPLPPSTAGQEACFYFVARDSHNNARGVGGEVFSATLHGPETMHAEVDDQGDGAYAVRYCPRRAGDYQLHVTKGETHIAGSPFSLTVHPGISHVPSCAAYGPALQLGEAGERQSFIVEARHTQCTHHTHCTHCTHYIHILIHYTYTHCTHYTYYTYYAYCTYLRAYCTPFLIEARDAHSNPTGRAGDRYIATIVGPREASPAFRRSAGMSAAAEKPEIITCEIVDRGDGTHEVRPPDGPNTERAVTCLALPWRYLLWLCLPWLLLPWPCLPGELPDRYSYCGHAYQVSYLIDLVGHYAMTVDDELGDQIAGSPFELVVVGGVSSAPHSVLLRPRPYYGSYYGPTYYGPTYYGSTHHHPTDYRCCAASI